MYRGYYLKRVSDEDWDLIAILADDEEIDPTIAELSREVLEEALKLCKEPIVIITESDNEIFPMVLEIAMSDDSITYFNYEEE